MPPRIDIYMQNQPSYSLHQPVDVWVICDGTTYEPLDCALSPRAVESWCMQRLNKSRDELDICLNNGGNLSVNDAASDALYFVIKLYRGVNYKARITAADWGAGIKYPSRSVSSLPNIQDVGRKTYQRGMGGCYNRYFGLCRRQTRLARRG